LVRSKRNSYLAHEPKEPGMSVERPPKPAALRLGRDLEGLLKRANERPGLAEAIQLHERYQAQLAEINKRISRDAGINVTVSDSTG
jgi:hypothetical protein